MNNYIIHLLGIKQYCLVLCLFLLNYGLVVAQSQPPKDCERRLAEAQTAFSKGELEQALLLIEACASHAHDVFTKEEALIAQTLLATLYVELRQQEKARIRMTQLLHDNPRYLTSEEADKLQLINLRKEFKVFPRVSVGLELGTMLTHISDVGIHQIAQGNSQPDSLVSGNPTIKTGDMHKKYHSRLSDTYLLTATFTPIEHWQVYTGFGNKELRFRMTPSEHYYMPHGDISTEIPTLYEWSYTARQSLKYYFIRGGLRYEFGDWRSHNVRPFIEIGAQHMWLHRAERVYLREIYQSINYMPDSTQKGTPIQDAAEEISTVKSVYKQQIWSYFGGGGVNIGHKDLSYSLGCRAAYTPGNLNDPAHRYDDKTGVYLFNHIEDDISLRWLSLYVSANYTFGYAVKHRPAVIKE